MGHIMRCVAFAYELSNAGFDPHFFVKSLDSSVGDLIGGSGFAVHQMAADIGMADDALFIRERAAGLGAILVVTDICHRETQSKPEELTAYHEVLSAGLFTVAITGDKQLDLPADIVVTPYAGVPDPDISGRTKQVVLLGPSYFIFRPEFIAAARMDRTIDPVGSKVLVTVGGSDGLHFTTKIVEALCAVSNIGLSVRVALGAGFTSHVRLEVQERLKTFKGQYEVFEHTANLAEAMCWADLAITGDGLTKYEAALTGTPSIVLSRADSEMTLTREFENLGTSLHMGDGALVDTDELARTIECVLEDASFRASMSRKGKTLVDGKGAERIIAHFPAGVR
jgi:spore coat polysaccharide biosynthesis predicted glycosyltransferase SpsG